MVLITMNTEGHFVGTSSGAIVHAAVEYLEANGGTAVVVLPDAGWKYLSGNPWADAAQPVNVTQPVPALAH